MCSACLRLLPRCTLNYGLYRYGGKDLTRFSALVTAADKAVDYAETAYSLMQHGQEVKEARQRLSKLQATVISTHAANTPNKIADVKAVVEAFAAARTSLAAASTHNRHITVTSGGQATGPSHDFLDAMRNAERDVAAAVAVSLQARQDHADETARAEAAAQAAEEKRRADEEARALAEAKAAEERAMAERTAAEQARREAEAAAKKAAADAAAAKAAEEERARIAAAEAARAAAAAKAAAEEAARLEIERAEKAKADALAKKKRAEELAEARRNGRVIRRKLKKRVVRSNSKRSAVGETSKDERTKSAASSRRGSDRSQHHGGSESDRTRGSSRPTSKSARSKQDARKISTSTGKKPQPPVTTPPSTKSPATRSMPATTSAGDVGNIPPNPSAAGVVRPDSGPPDAAPPPPAPPGPSAPFPPSAPPPQDIPDAAPPPPLPPASAPVQPPSSPPPSTVVPKLPTRKASVQISGLGGDELLSALGFSSSDDEPGPPTQRMLSPVPDIDNPSPSPPANGPPAPSPSPPSVEQPDTGVKVRESRVNKQRRNSRRVSMVATNAAPSVSPVRSLAAAKELDEPSRVTKFSGRRRRSSVHIGSLRKSATLSSLSRRRSSTSAIDPGMLAALQARGSPATAVDAGPISASTEGTPTPVGLGTSSSPARRKSRRASITALRKAMEPKGESPSVPSEEPGSKAPSTNPSAQAKHRRGSRRHSVSSLAQTASPLLVSGGSKPTKRRARRASTTVLELSTSRAAMGPFAALLQPTGGSRRGRRNSVAVTSASRIAAKSGRKQRRNSIASVMCGPLGSGGNVTASLDLEARGASATQDEVSKQPPKPPTPKAKARRLSLGLVLDVSSGGLAPPEGKKTPRPSPSPTVPPSPKASPPLPSPGRRRGRRSSISAKVPRPSVSPVRGTQADDTTLNGTVVTSQEQSPARAREGRSTKPKVGRSRRNSSLATDASVARLRERSRSRSRSRSRPRRDSFPPRTAVSLNDGTTSSLSVDRDTGELTSTRKDSRKSSKASSHTSRSHSSRDPLRVERAIAAQASAAASLAQAAEAKARADTAAAEAAAAAMKEAHNAELQAVRAKAAEDAARLAEVLKQKEAEHSEAASALAAHLAKERELSKELEQERLRSVMLQRQLSTATIDPLSAAIGGMGAISPKTKMPGGSRAGDDGHRRYDEHFAGLDSGAELDEEQVIAAGMAAIEATARASGGVLQRMRSWKDIGAPDSPAVTPLALRKQRTQAREACTHIAAAGSTVLDLQLSSVLLVLHVVMQRLRHKVTEFGQAIRHSHVPVPRLTELLGHAERHVEAAQVKYGNAHGVV